MVLKTENFTNVSQNIGDGSISSNGRHSKYGRNQTKKGWANKVSANKVNRIADAGAKLGGPAVHSEMYNVVCSLSRLYRIRLPNLRR